MQLPTDEKFRGQKAAEGSSEARREVVSPRTSGLVSAGSQGWGAGSLSSCGPVCAALSGCLPARSLGNPGLSSSHGATWAAVLGAVATGSKGSRPPGPAPGGRPGPRAPALPAAPGRRFLAGAEGPPPGPRTLLTPLPRPEPAPCALGPSGS